MKNTVITIDGPCGAGKTTIAKALAEKFGMTYIDTGGIYRTIAYACQDKLDVMYGGDTDARKAVMNDVLRTGISMDTDPANGIFRLGTRHLNSEIRTERISQLSSELSTMPEIREAANSVIRSIAASRDVVVEGRDTGTRVFTDAQVKFYLTADIRTRAERRLKQFPEQYPDIDTAIADIDVRDTRDTTRTLDPLRIPDKAMVIDSTFMDLPTTIDHMSRLAGLVLDYRTKTEGTA